MGLGRNGGQLYSGNKGPTGDKGPPGGTYKLAWSNVTAYAIGDVVTLGGSAYICNQAHTGHTPPNASYWDASGTKGDTGATGATGPTGPAGTAVDATTTTIGAVEVDHAASGAHSVALTTDGTSLPTGMLGVASNQALPGGGAVRHKANAASDFANPHTFVKGTDYFIGVDVVNFELDLPDANLTTDGTLLIIKNRNQTGTTIKTFTAQNIDGVDCSVTPYALSGAYGVLRLQCDDGAWWTW